MISRVGVSNQTGFEMGGGGWLLGATVLCEKQQENGIFVCVSSSSSLQNQFFQNNKGI